MKTIYKIEAERNGEEIDVKCGLEDEDLDIVAGCIAVHAKKYPRFKEALFESLIKQFGTIILVKDE